MEQLKNVADDDIMIKVPAKTIHAKTVLNARAIARAIRTAS